MSNVNWEKIIDHPVCVGVSENTPMIIEGKDFWGIDYNLDEIRSSVLNTLMEEDNDRILKELNSNINREVFTCKISSNTTLFGNRDKIIKAPLRTNKIRQLLDPK